MICRGAARYVAEYRDSQATLHVQSVLAKISLCRTTALGGHWYECDDCKQITKLHNSCGDRHCPACSGGKRYAWNEETSKLLLQGVDYYQVVFTLPDILSTLALANRKELADVLFQSAWKALKKTVSGEQGYDPAAMMVLHTWNQKLDAHWHVHALVPGGGPSLLDGSWTEVTAPQVDGASADGTSADGTSEGRKYLVDATNLRTLFRKFAIAHLRRLRRAGILRFGGSLEYLHSDDAWESLLDDLASVDWVSHIEPPPNERSRPEHVVRYLTRYLTGGPISDHRFIAANDNEVTFMAREGETVGGDRRQVPHTIPTAEFVRRWCLHIQSNQLTKTRYFGGWSNTRKEGYLECSAIALDVAGIGVEDEIDFDPKSFDASLGEFEGDGLVCEHCGGESLTLIKTLDKPSWKVVLSPASEACPRWYVKSRELDDRQFWDAAMGSGFSDWYDWYLKSGVESAREQVTEPGGRATQLSLPGLEESGNCEMHSL